MARIGGSCGLRPRWRSCSARRPLRDGTARPSAPPDARCGFVITSVVLMDNADFAAKMQPPTKMAALEKRKAGDQHPYVVGTDSIRRYLKVAEECARVGALGEK